VLEGRETHKIFPEFWTVDECEKGLRNGTLHEGLLRVNPKVHFFFLSIMCQFIGCVSEE